MYVITVDTPSSELSEEDETSKAPSHGDVEDVGEQEEELPARQRQKQGNGSQQPSNPRPKRRRQ